MRKNLSELGYKTISFETEYDWVEIPDADIYFTIQTPGAFIQTLLNTTEFDFGIERLDRAEIIDKC